MHTHSKRLSRLFARWVSALSRERLLFIASGISIVIYLTHATYVSYPDEFINILGGRTILHGGLPYRDYFDHHMPLAWYLSSVLLFVSGGNFIFFRIAWALLQWSVIMMTALWIYTHHRRFTPWFALLQVLFPAVGQYLWLHLFLGDSLATLFFIPVLVMALLETGERSSSRLVWYAAPLAIAALIFSSLSYLYLGIMLYVWIAWLYIQRHAKVSTSWITTIKSVLTQRQTYLILGVAAAPYVMYGLVLGLTGTSGDFWFANFSYNTEHYIYVDGYVRGARFNPLRFALTLFDNFWKAYLTAIHSLAEFSFYLPLTRLAVLSTLTLLLLNFRKGWITGLIFLFVLSFSAPRNPQLVISKETDYQIGLYIMFGLTASVYALFALSTYYAHERSLYKKAINVVAFVWISIFLLSTTLFATFGAYHVWYERYMGNLSPIVNYSPVAEYIDRIIVNGDTYWIGPFEGHNYFFVKNGVFAGKYPSLLPQFSESDFLRQDFIAQMEKYRPSVVIFKHASGIFGTPADKFGAFFLDYLNSRYVTCKSLERACAQNLPGFDVVGDVYVRKDRADIIQKL